MPWIPGENIVNCEKYPTENGFEKVKLIWNNSNGLLVTKQVGATCGIYALHAAAKVLGKHYAIPPAKKQDLDSNWRQTWQAGGSIPAQRPDSILSRAKRMGLSQVGEINGADDLQKLATSIGIATNILTFRDADQLWEGIVASVEAGDAIVFPYTSANDDGVVGGIKDQDGFTHWGLLCGYGLDKQAEEDPRCVFMTTYGQHHMDTVSDLYASNLAIQDWSAQRWHKIHAWTLKPQTQKEWTFWQTTWMPDLAIREILMGWVEEPRKNNDGLAIGTKEKPLYILCNPGWVGAMDNPDKPLGVFMTTRSVDFTDMPYKANMAGKCVVVTKS